MASVSEDAIGVTELQRFREALAALESFVSETSRPPASDSATSSFRTAETELLGHVARLSSAGTAVLAQAWQPTDDELVHGGTTYRRVSETSRGVYFGLHGRVEIQRYLYREVGVRNGATVVPLELAMGVVEGRWTPRAAEAVAHLSQAVTSRDATEMASTLHVLPFSRSSLHRCAEAVGGRWEAIAHNAEQTMVEQMEIPDEAVMVSVGVDRVSLPMEEPAEPGNKDGAKVRRNFRMSYCGILTLHDGEGEPLTSIRYGRMPTRGRELLETSLAADVATLLQRRSDLVTIGLADGAAEMQLMLERILRDHRPKAILIDKYHLLEKFAKAVTSTGREAASWVRAWKTELDQDDRAVERIEMRLKTWALQYDPEELPEPLYDALTYIENNREGMRYASVRAANLPVGSGGVEATCKTLVSVRMKRAGARWKETSGQAILNLRSLACSQRWRPAMDLTFASYVHRLAPVQEAA